MELNNRVEARTERSLEHRVLARNARGVYRTDIDVRGHTLIVDEPEELSGLDLGPTPYDLLCSALAACTAISVQMYSDRKGWPLEAVVVYVELNRPVGGNCEPYVSEAEVFRVRLEFEGELTEGQRERLMEIADHSAMHRSLRAGAVIETERASIQSPL